MNGMFCNQSASCLCSVCGSCFIFFQESMKKKLRIGGNALRDWMKRESTRCDFVGTFNYEIASCCMWLMKTMIANDVEQRWRWVENLIIAQSIFQLELMFVPICAWWLPNANGLSVNSELIRSNFQLLLRLTRMKSWCLISYKSNKVG